MSKVNTSAIDKVYPSTSKVFIEAVSPLAVLALKKKDKLSTNKQHSDLLTRKKSC